MQPDPRDMALLWDMLDSTRNAIEFTKDFRYEKFLKDKKVRLAVERSLEIIGEAAKNVSQCTRDPPFRHPLEVCDRPP